MNKNLFFRIGAAFALMLGLSACVDENYDLSKVDTTMTIIPGLTIPLDVQPDPVGLSETFFKTSNPVIDEGEDHSMIIGNIDGRNNIRVGVPADEIGRQHFIKLPGFVEISCGSLLEDIIPGAVFRIDASPVCNVTNPLNHPLKLSGKARCGGKEVAFGPYEVPAGFSKVKLEDDALKVFLNPVESDIVLFDMVLDGVLASDAVPMTKSSGEYVFDITGYIPLEFEAGDEISVSVPLEDVSEVDIKEIADEYGVDVKSFILNVDVVNNAPFELTATASALTGGKMASATMDPAIAAGSIESPVTTRTAVTVILPDGVTDLTEIELHIKAKAMADPSYIKSNHTLTFKPIDLVFNKGVQISL